MGSGDFEERLKWFKENEKPEVVLMVANNEQRVWLVVAWMNTNVTRLKRQTHLSYGSENVVWEWLWENTRFSIDELRIRSAVSEGEIESGMKLLIANRIIYPDGTINSYVQRYLRERVFKLFVERPRRAVGKTKF